MTEANKTPPQGHPAPAESVEKLTEAYELSVSKHLEAPTDETKSAVTGAFDALKAAREKAKSAPPVPAQGGDKQTPPAETTYENLKLPEVHFLPEGHLDSLRELGKAGKIPEDKLAALLDRDVRLTQGVMDRIKAEDARIRSEWVPALKEHWGDKFEVNAANGAKVLTAFQTANPDSKLKEKIEKGKFSEEPDFAKFLLWIHKELGMAEDTLPQESGADGTAQTGQFSKMDADFKKLNQVPG